MSTKANIEEQMRNVRPGGIIEVPADPLQWPSPNVSVDRKKALLEDAIKAVSGERHANYGPPEKNFRRIATLWNAWFTITERVMSPIQPWEVAILCGLINDARLANQPCHRDSWVDKAGYAACGSDITESMK